MSRPRRQPPSGQGELFVSDRNAVAASPNAPDLDIHHEMLGAIALALKEAKKRGLGRELVVDRMNLCLPELVKPITKRQLDSWTAESKEYSEFPARFLPAFCWACMCDAPLATGPRSMGYDLVDRADEAALEMGRLRLQQAEIAKREREIKRRLGGE